MANAPKAPEAPAAPEVDAPIVPETDAPETAADEFEFGTVEVPASTRANPLVNPFDKIVGALAASMKGADGKVAERSTEAKTVTVATPKAAKVKRQLGEAGKVHDVTVRSIPKETGDSTTFTFWTVKRIAHSR